MKISTRIFFAGLGLWSAAFFSRAEAVIKNDTYNMPPAVLGTMGVDEAMQKMEATVKPDVLAAFKKANPAPFWLFGEDRQLAVRNNIIPAHWFENGAKQHGKFAGVARPGEFYVFQVCVVANAETRFAAKIDTTIKLAGSRVTLISKSPVVGGAFKIETGAVKPLWVGIQIPADAKHGTYQGTVEISTAMEDVLAPNRNTANNPDIQKAVCTLALTIEGEPIAEEGTGPGEGWRLARLKWLDSTIGNSDTEVTRPFLPIVMDEKARTLDILGRRITLGENGIPAQFTSFFSGSNTKILKEGRNAFVAAPRLEFLRDGKLQGFTPKKFEFSKKTAVGVEWTATSVAGDLQLLVVGRLEYDGNLKLEMRIRTPRDESLDDVRFVVPWAENVVKYSMGIGMQGGKCPDSYDWKWDVSKHQDAVWLGDANIGLMLRFKGGNFKRPLINAYYDFSPLNLPESWGGGGIQIEKQNGLTTLTASSGKKDIAKSMVQIGEPCFNIDWYFTPFKPINTKEHFTDRYYHIGQGAEVENTAELHQNGANIMEIHHNRYCNPYINYPYNDDSLKHLTAFVKKAHADKMRVAVYYTTRELTQNLPEFFALKSLDGEVILPRKEGVNWPVTNGGGPHPWLKAHVGMDIVPAWRENIGYEYNKLDLAMITTPDSRWNNFYLEGLDFMIRHAGIDGLYVDDTALDRKSMQRARRILDADGNTGRRVSMHSWDHFNNLAKWANSSIAFMELYPYYNGLWHGEGFNANAAAPEFMLVEMSGIPYGLMSEMLDSPNDWHGMVFGETRRWPWSGDPRSVWKLMDTFGGLADAEFVGWFDPACPVTCDNPQIKVSVYRKQGKTMISLASWSPKRVMVRLGIDWKVLGLDPKKTTLWAPVSGSFQPERVFAADAAIPVDSGKGWLLIADETPRDISGVDVVLDPLKGLTLKAEDTAAFEIAVPANTVKVKDVPWVAGTTAVTAHISPLQDEGQSWGVGLAVGWADGKSVQINCRTSGQWGICRNGAEMLVGDHGKGKPATVAIVLADQTVQLLAKEDDNEEWQVVAQFPRTEFPGVPSAIRVGKLGRTWSPQDHNEKGGTSPCRVDWVRLYGISQALNAQETPKTDAWKIPSNKENFHIFILMGQSNMSGYGAMMAEDMLAVPHVLKLPTKGALSWEPAAHPLHNRLDSDRFGLGLPFAREYLKNHPGVAVGLIPLGWGGAGIDLLKKGTPTYAEATNKANFSMSQGVVKGVLWHQGESDSVNKDLADSYESKLHQFVSDFRRDLGIDKLPFIAGNLAEFYGTGPEHNAPERVKNIDKIRSVLRALPQQVKYTGFVESTGCSSFDGHNVHFNRESYIILGERYAKVYEDLTR